MTGDWTAKEDGRAAPEWFDASGGGLHRLVFPERYDYGELDRVLSGVTAYYRRFGERREARRFGLLVDLSQVESTDRKNRARVAAALAVLSDVFELHCAGQAYVVTKPLVRGALAAVLALRRPGWPVRTFASRDEGERWLSTLLVSR